MTDYVNPYSTSSRWLKGNLHAHTCCGTFMDLAESGAIYATLGYDFIAVTDHDKTHDAEQIQQWSNVAGLVVVPGEENGKANHIVELGVHHVTETPGETYQERAQALRDAGGFVFGCHPQEYRHGDENIREGASALHAMEIYNGLREARGTDETRNVTLWDEVLTNGEQLWAVANDDFHLDYVTPGHGWVQVQVPEDARVSWSLIVEQLKRGAFYASTYPSFERIELHNGTLHVKADKRTRQLRVVGPGGRTLAECEDSALKWSVTSGLTYFRIEAISGVKRAWSQPFFAA